MSNLKSQITEAVKLVPVVESLLSNEAKFMLEQSAMKRRDKREPRRKEKEDIEDEIASLMLQRFKRQKKRFLGYLEIMSGRKSMKYIDWIDQTIGGWEDDPDDQRIVAKLVRVVARAIRSGIDIFGDEIGINYDWSIVNAEALQFAARYTYDLVKDIDSTTVDILRRQVSSFIETPGMTIGDLVESLPFGERRALTVAVTETTRAYAEGQKVAGEELKKDYPDVRVTKTWFTNNDEKVCEICMPFDGLTVNLDEPFVDEKNVEYDNPPAHPNCRCWLSTRTRING